MKFSLLFLFLLLNFLSYSADKIITENKNSQAGQVLHKKNENYILHVKKATAPLKIDGLISEPDWNTAEKAKDFVKSLKREGRYLEDVY